MENFTLLIDAANSYDKSFAQEYLRRNGRPSRVAQNLQRVFDELDDIEPGKNISTDQKSFATGIDMLLAAADHVERYGTIRPTARRCSHVDSLLREILLDGATAEMNGSTTPMQVPNAPASYVSSNESPSSQLTPANTCPLSPQDHMLTVGSPVMILRDLTSITPDDDTTMDAGFRLFKQESSLETEATFRLGNDDLNKVSF